MPGTYTGQGWTCNLTRGVLPTGRAEGALACTSPTDSFTASWVNGQIDGHPFELDLRASKIDTIPGHAQFAWGKVGNTVFNRVYHGCITTNVVVSARQVGDQVSINGYRSDGTARCGITLTRNP